MNALIKNKLKRLNRKEDEITTNRLRTEGKGRLNRVKLRWSKEECVRKKVSLLHPPIIFLKDNWQLNSNVIELTSAKQSRRRLLSNIS